MNPCRTYYISFAHQQVAVVSDAVEVLAPFLLSFKALLKESPTDLLATLTVEKGEDGYSLVGAEVTEADGVNLHRILQCLKFEVIHRFVQEHPELLWLHAGAAALDGFAIVLCGAWGSGKSTLVGHLCQKGWAYLSDDIVPIDLASGRLISFPLTPMMRLHEEEDDNVEYSPAEISNLNKQVVDLAENAFTADAQHIAAIVFPRFDPAAEGSVLTSIPPATAVLELLRNCLDLKYHKEKAVQYLGSLVEQLPVYMLRYKDGDAASDELILSHLNRARLPANE